MASADAVFVGELVAESDLAFAHDAREHATLDYDPSTTIASYFVVTRVFMGDLRVGQRVRVLNSLNVSTCDRGGYAQVGSTWLLLVWGSEGSLFGRGACTFDRKRQPSAALLQRVEQAVAEQASADEPPPLRRSACRATEGESPLGAGLLVLGLFGVRRRRAIHSRPCRSSTPSSPTPTRCMPRSS